MCDWQSHNAEDHLPVLLGRCHCMCIVACALLHVHCCLCIITTIMSAVTTIVVLSSVVCGFFPTMQTHVSILRCVKSHNISTAFARS